MDKILQNIKSTIEHSGFPLEHYIAKVLKQHGWHIITNRNYIDDIKGIEREIDILAYKIYTDNEENIQYLTSLMISCKKSKKHKWCFLTRDIDENERNINWTPYHYCTSDERLKYMSEKHLDTVITSYITNEKVKELYSFDKMVFAYQQLSEPANDKERKQNGIFCCVKNDDIYNSISTTIKAIDSEKISRLKAYGYEEKQRYYTFHALSIFEGDMFSVHFDANSSIDVETISDIKYLNRHIIGGVDDFYIVHFINKDIFEEKLSLYDSLHEENIKAQPKFITEFYKDIFKDRDKVDIFLDKFKGSILWKIKWILQAEQKNLRFDNLNISPYYRENKLELELSVNDYFIDEGIIKKLNTDKFLNAYVKDKLLSIYRYDGEFCFCNDILPF